MTKKLLALSAILSLTFFAGCSSKEEATNSVKKVPLNAQTVQYTKKQDITIQNRVKVMVTATDLNAVYNKQPNKTQKFLLSVFEVGQTSVKKDDLKVLMNEQSLKSIKQLTKENDLYKSIPLRNVWATYFIVEFDKSKENLNRLSLSYKEFNPITFGFQAEH